MSLGHGKEVHLVEDAADGAGKSKVADLCWAYSEGGWHFWLRGQACMEGDCVRLLGPDVVTEERGSSLG